MKNIILTIITVFSMLTSIDTLAYTREVYVTVWDQNAKVHANGVYYGQGNRKLLVQKNVPLVVTVSMEDYESQSYTFYYERNKPADKSYHFTLKKKVDEAMEAAASQSDWANSYVTINTSKTEALAWKTFGIVIRPYFNEFESSDPAQGYIRTTWIRDNFTENTVRTRVIVEQASIDPLSYRVKLVSEIAKGSNISAKEDEKFKTWDRMLRKYENMMSELQTRLK